VQRSHPPQSKLENPIRPNLKLLAVASALVVTVSGIALARTGLGALYTQTPDEMKFTPDPAHAGYASSVLVGDPAKPGVYAVRTRLPSNIRIDPHTHSEKWRIATVLSGTLYYGHGDTFDERKLKALGPGSLLVEPPGAPHFAMTKGDEVMLHIVGEGPAGTIAVRK
jgi:quercetin dioxygenase-like cupin family protein